MNALQNMKDFKKEIKRKPQPSEPSKESLSTIKEMSLRKRLSRVVYKPIYAAKLGN
jgi:hypothetical protein